MQVLVVLGILDFTTDTYVYHLTKNVGEWVVLMP
jgi:hypothetical protein